MQQLPVDLGVVPIVVNAGAALGPLLIAPIATFFGILFKPSALLALLRRKPWLPVPIVLGGVGLYFLLAWAFAPAPAVAARGAAAANTSALPIPEGDWTKLAHKLLRDEQFAAKTTGVKPVREYNPEEGMMVLTGPATDPPGAQGRVFAGAAIQDVGSFIGQLFALDKDLQLLWKIEKHGDDDLKAFFSSPVLSPDGKSLIVGQGLHEDKDCALICVDAATGAARWKVQTSLHIESSPAVWKDLVVVGAGAIEDANHKPTGDPGFVLGVQISTGKTLWKHAVNDPESSPAIHPDDGTVYIGAGFNGNAVVALRPEADEDLKGAKRELWRTAAPYPVTGPVTLAGDLVLVGGGTSDFVNVSPTPAGVVMALDRKTGAVRWQTKTPDSVLGRIVTHHNVAYFPVLSGRVLALDLATGKELWNKQVAGTSLLKAGLALSAPSSSPPPPTPSSPPPLTPTLFAVTADGYLILLNPADGAVIEKHALSPPGKASKKGLNLSTPTVRGADVYVGSETGGLRHFRAVSAK